MIVEWLAIDGTTARFDNVSYRITYLDPEGIVVVPARDANQSEVDEYKRLYPAATQEEITAKQAVMGKLMSVLVQLRSVTQDGNIDPVEFEAMNAPVQDALLSYSTYPRTDPEVTKLAFLVLTQVVYSYSFLLQQGKTNLKYMFDYAVSLEGELQALAARVEALEGQ